MQVRDASMLEGGQRVLDLWLMEKHPKIPPEESFESSGIWERDQRVVNLPLCSQGSQPSPTADRQVCAVAAFIFLQKNLDSFSCCHPRHPGEQDRSSAHSLPPGLGAGGAVTTFIFKPPNHTLVWG